MTFIEDVADALKVYLADADVGLLTPQQGEAHDPVIVVNDAGRVYVVDVSELDTHD